MTIGYAFTALVAVIGYLIFIPSFGMWGAAGIICLSEFLIALLTLIVVARTARAWPNLIVTIKAGLAGLIMFFILTLLPTWPVLLTISLGIVVYLAALTMVGGINIREIKSLLTKT
jgi:O-antigen/teichoic acid export membrane protein